MQAQKNGIQIEDPENPVKPSEQTECPLFCAIPTEIRHIIYRYLLTTPDPIQKVHSHLGSKETAMLDQYTPIPDIDAAILRTCRRIYSEALPILYGMNVFQFDCAHNIRGFQSRSLTSFPMGMHLSSRRSRSRGRDAKFAHFLSSVQLKTSSHGSLDHAPSCCIKS